MKQMFFWVAICTVTLVACNNSNTSPKQNEMSKIPARAGTDGNMDTSKNVADTTPVTEVNHSFNNVNPNLAASLKTVVNDYLQIKNALINNSGHEAAGGGRDMVNAMEKIDKSFFTNEQKKLYDDIEDDLKENAEHIGKSSGDIGHQREHFSMMSEDMYDLVKAFGGGEPLYHDHCPMANDQKGAMWLSETKQVSNPYFGGKMNECVKVQEVIK